MPPDSDPIRVVLAEPAPLFREGVAALCDLRAGVEVVGKVAGSEDILRLADRLAPDVLLADVRLLTGGAPVDPVRIVALVEEHQDETLRQRVLDLLAVGVAGFVSRRDEVEALFEAVRVVASGEVWISPRVATRLVPGRPGEAEAALARLTHRERELLRRAATGQANDEIAAAMSLAAGTLRNRLSAVYQKLGVRTKAEAVAWAWRHGVAGERAGSAGTNSTGTDSTGSDSRGRPGTG